MSKARKCPSCSISIPIDRGFIFDKNLNMVCGNCGKIVVPAKAASEAELESSLREQRWKTPLVRSYGQGMMPHVGSRLLWQEDDYDPDTY